MTYDDVIARRIREVIGDRPALAERKMFGGLAFLVDGHMVAAANSQGEVMVRLDRDDADRAVRDGHGELVVMGDRTMRGWLALDLAGHSDDALATWVSRSLDFVATLPPKT